MSNLIKPYEITIWADDYTEDGAAQLFSDRRLVIIGSDKMGSQNRAFDPKLTCPTNGANKLTFQMLYRYIDNETGEKTDNLFTKYLVNESKVRLHYEDNGMILLSSLLKRIRPSIP